MDAERKQLEAATPEFPEWEWAIVRACEKPEERWMASRFIEKLRAHKRRYPAFIEERVAQIFFNEPSAKVRSFYCFQPVNHFTKHIHKGASVFAMAEHVRSTPLQGTQS